MNLRRDKGILSWSFHHLDYECTFLQPVSLTLVCLSSGPADGLQPGPSPLLLGTNRDSNSQEGGLMTCCSASSSRGAAVRSSFVFFLCLLFTHPTLSCSKGWGWSGGLGAWMQGEWQEGARLYEGQGLWYGGSERSSDFWLTPDFWEGTWVLVAMGTGAGGTKGGSSRDRLSSRSSEAIDTEKEPMRASLHIKLSASQLYFSI